MYVPLCCFTIRLVMTTCEVTVSAFSNDDSLVIFHSEAFLSILVDSLNHLNLNLLGESRSLVAVQFRVNGSPTMT